LHGPPRGDRDDSEDRCEHREHEDPGEENAGCPAAVAVLAALGTSLLMLQAVLLVPRHVLLHALLVAFHVFHVMLVVVVVVVVVVTSLDWCAIL
jgi:hypothetical protein